MPHVVLADIQTKVENVLQKAFGAFKLDYVELASGVDHDEDAAVFVTAVLKPNAPPMPGEISVAASVAVADVLQDAGDERLTYLYIKRPDDERPEYELSPLSGMRSDG